MLLLSLTLLQASGACLVAGLLLWSMLSLAQRRWPELAAQRSIWLGALLVLAATFVLPLLPESRQLSVVPVLVVPELAVPVSPDRLALSAPAMLSSASLQPAAVDWRALAPLALSAYGLLYLLGVFHAAWRWGRGHAMLRALCKLAQRRRLHGVAVMVVDAPVSPMLVGVWRPRLLLPAHLAQFTLEQQKLVLAHELTHARRRDPLLLLLATVLQTLLWFNPAARWLVGKLVWAQELGCDRQVLAGRPRRQHQQYAAALVRQLGLQMQTMPGLAFGGSQAGMRDRLLRLRSERPAATPALRMLAILMLCVTGVASLVLQPALAWTAAAPAELAELAEPSGQLAAPPQPWRNPLASMRVLAFFGVVRPTTLDGVRGLDLAAKRGTPVQATADGIATASEDARLGKTVRIDHGGGWQSWYVHLDRVDISDGEVVASGQVIGTVGDTGFATGPHLHFQVWHNGRLQDPQSRLAGLDANASARALRMRREQFGR